jgi:general secretion pathway protein A
VPRLVNVLCDSALLTGYSRELAAIDASVIDEVARELRLPDLASVESPPQVPPAPAKRRGWLGLFR